MVRVGSMQCREHCRLLAARLQTTTAGGPHLHTRVRAVNGPQLCLAILDRVLEMNHSGLSWLSIRAFTGMNPNSIAFGKVNSRGRAFLYNPWPQASQPKQFVSRYDKSQISRKNAAVFVTRSWLAGSPSLRPRVKRNSQQSVNMNRLVRYLTR